MPLPLIPAVGALIALGGTAIGAKKGYDAYSDSKDAKSTNQTAQDIFDNSQALLDKNREFTNNNIEKFGKFRIKVFKDYLLYYIKIFDKIKNIELEYNTLIDKKFDISLEEFEALKTEVLTMKSLLGDGTLVLGGLVAGPALAVAGWAMASSAEKAKNNAYTNLDKARMIEQSNNTIILKLSDVNKTIEYLREITDKLIDYFDDMLDDFEDLVNQNNDYNTYKNEEKELVHKSLLMAQTIKNLISVPLMDEDGEIAAEVRRVRRRSEKTLKNIIKTDKKFGY